jgi:hypothetical protein
MEKTACFSNATIKLEGLLLKRERDITALVMLFAVIAIVLGIVWLFLRKDTLLFTILGFSACYLIGRKFWRFRTQKMSLTSERIDIKGGTIQ